MLFIYKANIYNRVSSSKLLIRSYGVTTGCWFKVSKETTKMILKKLFSSQCRPIFRKVSKFGTITYSTKP